MSTNLYRVSSKSWVVTSDTHGEPAQFIDVDRACDFLMTLGVLDNEIDLALIDMVAKGTNRANFSVVGTFAFSDDAGFGS